MEKSSSLLIHCGSGGSVGIATHYELVGPGIESRWGENFPHPSKQQVLESTQPPVGWLPVLSSGVKRPGRGADHPPHLAPRLKSGTMLLLPLWDLYLYLLFHVLVL